MILKISKIYPWGFQLLYKRSFVLLEIGSSGVSICGYSISINKEETGIYLYLWYPHSNKKIKIINVVNPHNIYEND